MDKSTAQTTRECQIFIFPKRFRKYLESVVKVLRLTFYFILFLMIKIMLLAGQYVYFEVPNKNSVQIKIVSGTFWKTTIYSLPNKNSRWKFHKNQLK